MHFRVNEGLKVLAQKIFPPLSGLIRSIRQKMHFLRSCELELQFAQNKGELSSNLAPQPSDTSLTSTCSASSSCKAVLRIRIQSGQWIRIQIKRGKMTHKSRKKIKKFHVLKCWMFSFES
jgi:hypothetical protein